MVSITLEITLNGTAARREAIKLDHYPLLVGQAMDLALQSPSDAIAAFRCPAVPPSLTTVGKKISLDRAALPKRQEVKLFTASVRVGLLVCAADFTRRGKISRASLKHLDLDSSLVGRELRIFLRGYNPTSCTWLGMMGLSGRLRDELETDVRAIGECLTGFRFPHTITNLEGLNPAEMNSDSPQRVVSDLGFGVIGEGRSFFSRQVLWCISSRYLVGFSSVFRDVRVKKKPRELAKIQITITETTILTSDQGLLRIRY